MRQPIPMSLRPRIIKSTHKSNIRPNLHNTPPNILAPLHQINHHLRHLLRHNPIALLPHHLHLFGVLRPKRRQYPRRRDRVDSDFRDVARGVLEGGEGADEPVYGVLGGYVDGRGEVGTLAADGGYVDDGAGLLVRKEVCDCHLGDADGVGDVYVDEGEAGGGGVVF